MIIKSEEAFKRNKTQCVHVIAAFIVSVVLKATTQIWEGSERSPLRLKMFESLSDTLVLTLCPLIFYVLSILFPKCLSCFSTR